jgi:hypothetical protein
VRAAVVLASLAVLVMIGAGCSDYPKDEGASWTLRSSDPSSSVVDIRVLYGGCSTFRRADADETDRVVIIHAVVHTEGTTCKSILQGKDVSVTLRRPLGDRILRSGCLVGDESICHSPTTQAG